MLHLELLGFRLDTSGRHRYKHRGGPAPCLCRSLSLASHSARSACIKEHLPWPARHSRRFLTSPLTTLGYRTTIFLFGGTASFLAKTASRTHNLSMSTNSTTAALSPAYIATNNLPWLLGVTVSFHTLAWIMVILRVYTRIVLVKSFGKDDALMVMGLVCYHMGLALCSCTMRLTYCMIPAVQLWRRHDDTAIRRDVRMGTTL